MLKCIGKHIVQISNRPVIRLNPVPVGHPASVSSSGPVSKNLAGFLPEVSS